MSIDVALQLEGRRRRERPAFRHFSQALREALASGSASPVGRALEDAGSAEDALFAARIHGVSGLLARLPDLPGALEEGLTGDLLRLSSRAERLREDLSRLGERAAARGLPFVPLKGSLLAFDRYPDAALRPAADLDLLAPGGSFDAWTELLVGEGYELTARGRKDWVFARPSARTPDDFREHPDNPRPVELHRSLEVRLLGRTVDLTSRYVAGLRETRVAGIPALAPPDDLLWLHLLVHAGPALVGRGVRLIQIHDLRLAPPGPGVGVLAVDVLGEAAWGLATLAERTLPGTVPSAVLDSLPPPAARRRARWLDRPGLWDGTRERTVLVMSEIGLCAGPRAALARVVDALPEGSFLSRAYGRVGPGSLLRYYRDRISP